MTERRTSNYNSRPSVSNRRTTKVHDTTDVRSVSNVAYGSGTRPQTRSNTGYNWNVIWFAGAAVFVAVILFCALFPWPMQITLNGEEFDTTTKATLEDIFTTADLGIESGDFVAVDGSVIEAGAGQDFTAYVNGEVQPDHKAKPGKGDAVEFVRGENIMEEYTEEIQETSQGVTFEGTGALHYFTSKGTPGQTSVKTGLTSGITSSEVVQESQDAVMKFTNVDTGDNKVIALTFDDGPWDTYTAEVLDILKENGAKATFFTVGERVQKNPDLVKREYEEGHQVATHTWDHASGTGQGVNLGYMSADERIAEVCDGYQAIADACGVDVSEVSGVLRAPGGNFTTDVASSVLDYVTAEVGWNIDTTDWKKPGASSIAAQILKATSGSIVLMHDGGGDRSQTVQALASALPQLVEQGYTFVTIDELMQYVQ